MATATLEKHEIPGKPSEGEKSIPVSSLRSQHRLWRLFYKRGYNPKCELIFELDGDISRAIQRARAYCQTLNLVFIHVESFLHDLDEDEKVYKNE